MMEQLSGTVAVVTGASAGIGAAIVEKLLENGLQVIGLARRLDLMQQLSNTLSKLPGTFYPIQCDISVEDDIIQAFKWTKDNVGPVQILVNNAGVLREGFLHNGRTEEWRDTFNTNVLGLLVASREALLQMTRGGHVVHINSVAGHGVPRHRPPVGGAYPAAKHAVTALKMSQVSPGLTHTAMYTDEDRQRALPVLLPHDVADAVLFILAQPPRVLIEEIIIKPTGEHI